ncbi:MULTISPECIES: hypothetical protein [Mycolicibacter]|uniref:Uncharacterized protein n=1 Tax=Mycolicibacter longobardus TaxID=1108812 RepID=A0A1X1YBR4_9MYCO|nr:MULTISPECIES: hypothetical protein [Mycolicibacter]ORW08474.1 hypothetical protein AWC16_18915 [Mycolicibacter longobardus]RAV04417.1 hypothetical protein DQP56_00955 [Mycolicibacter senuensis]
MSYSATIIAFPQSDDPPLWESFGHLGVEDAYKAGEDRIHFVRPKDRIHSAELPSDGDDGNHIWNVFNAEGAPVAALIVSEEDPTDERAEMGARR